MLGVHLLHTFCQQTWVVGGQLDYVLTFLAYNHKQRLHKIQCNAEGQPVYFVTYTTTYTRSLAKKDPVQCIMVQLLYFKVQYSMQFSHVRKRYRQHSNTTQCRDLAIQS